MMLFHETWPLQPDSQAWLKAHGTALTGGWIQLPVLDGCPPSFPRWRLIEHRDYQQLISRAPAHWPRWAIEAEKMRQPGDRGVGDTIEKQIGLVGSRQVAAWFQSVMGETLVGMICPACLNALYPYVK